MRQQSLADEGFERYRKPTRRDQFLAEMEQIIPWRELCKVIKPFYRQKAQHAVELLQSAITEPRFRIHKPEGAMFLWLWFEHLPVSSLELYERLKKRGVLVVSGHYFFPGLSESWQHKDECLRVTYSQDDDEVRGGLAIIADVVREAYGAGLKVESSNDGV